MSNVDQHKKEAIHQMKERLKKKEQDEVNQK